MKVADKNEFLQVLDEHGNSLNKLELRSVIHKKGLWHNEVACICINRKRQILLQKRSRNKKSYPSCWGLFAGHVVEYDDIKESIIKEMREELVSEIKENNIFLLVDKIKNERDDNKCFVTCFCAFVDRDEKDILFQKEEIDEVKWFSFDEFKQMVRNEKGTIFKNNDYYKSIIQELEKLFNSVNFARRLNKIIENICEYDSQGDHPTGRIVSREFAHNYGIWHKIVSLVIINKKHQILLQKRSSKKIRNPGLWDISVSGHVLYNEDEFMALKRECYEETGIKIKGDDVKFLTTCKEKKVFNKNFIDNHICDVYYMITSKKPKQICDLEVEKLKYFSLNELIHMMRNYKHLAYKPDLFKAVVELLQNIEAQKIKIN